VLSVVRDEVDLGKITGSYGSELGQPPFNPIMIVEVIRPIWTSRPETASRVRGRIESILDWAATNGFREGENPARWSGHLENILPKRDKLAAVAHHGAIPYADIPTFMSRIAAQDGTPARALEMLALTAVRSNELLGAR
jgi:hypothetical protein